MFLWLTHILFITLVFTFISSMCMLARGTDFSISVCLSFLDFLCVFAIPSYNVCMSDAVKLQSLDLEIPEYCKTVEDVIKTAKRAGYTVQISDCVHVDNQADKTTG